MDKPGGCGANSGLSRVASELDDGREHAANVAPPATRFVTTSTRDWSRKMSLPLGWP